MSGSMSQENQQIKSQNDAIAKRPSKDHCKSANVGELCSRCRGIDFDHLFSLQRLRERDKDAWSCSGVFLIDLEASVGDLNDSDCSLCRTFGSVAYDFPDHRSTTYYLVAFSGFEMFLSQYPHDSERNIVLISVIGQKRWDPLAIMAYESCKNEFLTLKWPAQAGKSITVHSIHRELDDVGFAKRCLDWCLYGHDHPCQNFNRRTIPFFRLIDCQSRTVITAPPNAQYIALSYVWGAPIPLTDESNTQKTSHILDFPKVVTDSFQVALKLNISYLWVDKYCINQLDVEDMETQIEQMDLIYANSLLTIIAAAGEGPHYGLPGVAGTVRKEQPSLKIGEYHLVSTLRHGRDVVLESKWGTRGWTYQEGILSRRRLIFTDQQVFFECNSMNCAEAVQLNSDIDPLESDHSQGIFRHRTPGTQPWDILKYISEFSERELTYRSDSINALSGIFRVFERGDNPMYQLKGVPIFFPVPLRRDEEELMESKIMSKSANQGFVIGLTWLRDRGYHNRVPIFPSWSWAGWNGTIYHELALYRDHERNSNDAIVHLETQGGDLLPFPTHKSRLAGFLSQLPRSLHFIHIEARTFACSYCFSKSRVAPPYIELQFLISEDPVLIAATFELLPGPGLGEYRTLTPWTNPLTGILIGDTSGDSLEVAGLVVQECDGYYERVNCLSFRTCLFGMDKTGLKRISAQDEEKMGWFSKWMREKTVRKTIRLG
jgi:hypothetical protein